MALPKNIYIISVTRTMYKAYGRNCIGIFNVLGILVHKTPALKRAQKKTCPMKKVEWN